MFWISSEPSARGEEFHYDLGAVRPFETRASPIRLCRKRPFATHGRRPLPTSAAVCRIPCLILCLADVERVCQCRAPHAPWECVELDPVGLLAGARSSLISTAAAFARPVVNRSTSTTLTFDAAASAPIAPRA